MAKCKQCGRTGVTLTKDKKGCNQCRAAELEDTNIAQESGEQTESAEGHSDINEFLNAFKKELTDKFDSLENTLQRKITEAVTNSMKEEIGKVRRIPTKVE